MRHDKFSDQPRAVGFVGRQKPYRTGTHWEHQLPAEPGGWLGQAQQWAGVSISKTSREQLLAKIDATQSAEKESASAQLPAAGTAQKQVAIFIRDCQRPWKVMGEAGRGFPFATCQGCIPVVPCTPGHPGWLQGLCSFPQELSPSCKPCQHQLCLVPLGMPSLAVSQRGFKKQTKPPTLCWVLRVMNQPLLSLIMGSTSG